MNPARYRVLDIDMKSKRVLNFHRNTLHAVGEMLGAAGLSHTDQLTRRHLVRRLSASEIKLADQIYPRVTFNALIEGKPVDDPRLKVYWHRMGPDSFRPLEAFRPDATPG